MLLSDEERAILSRLVKSKTVRARDTVNAERHCINGLLSRGYLRMIDCILRVTEDGLGALEADEHALELKRTDPSVLEAVRNFVEHLSFTQIGLDWTETDNEQAHRKILALLDELKPAPKRRYDTTASCFEMDGPGAADGAYGLHFDNATAEEIAQGVLATLSGTWGLSDSSCDCRIALHIAPAGRGKDLPL